MARTLNARDRLRGIARRDSAKTMAREIGPWLGVLAGFAAMALLIDFCAACFLRMLL